MCSQPWLTKYQCCSAVLSEQSVTASLCFIITLSISVYSQLLVATQAGFMFSIISSECVPVCLSVHPYSSCLFASHKMIPDVLQVCELYCLLCTDLFFVCVKCTCLIYLSSAE